ncbi:hypothetical protein V6Z11_A06G162500 [Gossypium hirsutum]
MKAEVKLKKQREREREAARIALQKALVIIRYIIIT